MKPQVVSKTNGNLNVRVDFWHTAVGITVKRVLNQIAIAGVVILADALMSESVDWDAVIYGIRYQVGYVLLATFQTVRDPQIANTTEDTISVRKEK